MTLALIAWSCGGARWIRLPPTDVGKAVEWTGQEIQTRGVTATPLFAAGLVALGRPDEAAEALQAAMDRDPDILLSDRCYPELRSLESDPRYQDLLRRTGVPGW